MKRIVCALALAFAAVLAVAATGNWLATVNLTDGGHVLGNPAAKTKVIEFASYTCPHCAEFEREAGGVIKIAWVQPGKASFEVRHIIRDQVDMTVAMLTNCGPKERFFQNHTMFLTQQDKWVGAWQLALPSQKRRWEAGPLPSRFRAIASDLGFYDMMASRGYSRVDVDRCLGDEAMAKRIAASSEANATTYGVNSTPSFAVNGKTLAGAHTWEQLQAAVAPQLK